jgi:hypothetical protein
MGQGRVSSSMKTTAARQVISRWPTARVSEPFPVGSCQKCRASTFAALKGVADGLTRNKSQRYFKEIRLLFVKVKRFKRRNNGSSVG